ncbi:choline kinase family protein [Phragmitibacter flavus]|nr:choline kinase family protein [Phragmitibacter flavus]
MNLGVAADLQALPLAGGITNRNHLILVDGERRWVARQAGVRTEELGIDRAVEHASAVRAAELGFGAPVVAWWPEVKVMVSEFGEGIALCPKTAVEGGTLKCIVEALRNFHQSPGLGGRFITGEVVADYVAKSVRAGVELPQEVELALKVLQRIESALFGRVERMGLAPCHNDLLPGNFLRGLEGDWVWLLDWEYAGMGDRFFDLGNLAVNLEFDDAACEKLVELYCGEGATEADLAHLHLMRLCSDLRESMWGFLQAGISDLEEDFMGYGNKHLRRFLHHAEDARFNSWLEKVEITL